MQAHAISQLATHAVSLQAVHALVVAQNRAKQEIKDYSGRVHFVREDGLYDYYVIQRRRAVVECNFALGHIGQVAAARDNATVCGAATRALLAIAWRVHTQSHHSLIFTTGIPERLLVIDCYSDEDGEPGKHFGSYMTSLRVSRNDDFCI